MNNKVISIRDAKGRYTKKHGMYGTRLYHIWNGLRERCLNPNNKDYNNYGGRGITVCKEWDNAESFFKWALWSGYNDNLTLDRIDTNKGYCPSNCRWITSDEQQRNKRNNVILEFNGEKHCIAEWSEITGIKQSTIISRLRYGWDVEKTLTKIPHYNNKNRGKN